MSESIEVAPCGCEESVQLRHRSNSLQEQLQYLTNAVDKDENKNDLESLVQQNEALRQKNAELEADNQKLRLDAILKGSRQLHAEMNQNDIYSSERKEEPTEEKEMSSTDVQTEDFGHLENGCTVCATIEGIEGLCKQLKDDRAAMEEELGSATQKIAMITEHLEIELKAKQALQAEFDRDKAIQRKSLLRESREKQEFERLQDLYQDKQNEKLCSEINNQRLVVFGSNRVSDQLFRSLTESLEVAIARQNVFGRTICDVKKQESRTFGIFKTLGLLVGILMCFFVIFTIVFFASFASVSIDLTDPNMFYNRYQYV